jgi:hypothetical protein
MWFQFHTVLHDFGVGTGLAVSWKSQVKRGWPGRCTRFEAHDDPVSKSSNGLSALGFVSLLGLIVAGVLYV